MVYPEQKELKQQLSPFDLHDPLAKEIDWFGVSEKNFDFRFSIFDFRFSFFDFVKEFISRLLIFALRFSIFVFRF